MAKIIERGLGSEDDPIYFNGYIIGPILIPKRSTESGNDESKPANEDKGGAKDLDALEGLNLP